MVLAPARFGSMVRLTVPEPSSVVIDVTLPMPASVRGGRDPDEHPGHAEHGQQGERLEDDRAAQVPPAVAARPAGRDQGDEAEPVVRAGRHDQGDDRRLHDEQPAVGRGGDGPHGADLAPGEHPAGRGHDEEGDAGHAREAG